MTHHASRRGAGFVLLGDARSAFLRKAIGTGKKVLDIGCRDGSLTKLYMEGNTVTGLDIDSAALARAAELGIETRQVDLNGDWNTAPASYDVVVAAKVLEHLYYPEVVLEKIGAVLKPGGMLVGTVPNPYSLMNRFRYLIKQKRHTSLADPTHINHFSVQELQTLLEVVFTEVRVEGIGSLGVLARWFPQAFAFNLCFAAKGPKPRP